MRITVLTGAGISAESGIRTFRATDGLWEEHRIEDVATPEGFRRDPVLVHRFYNMRRADAARARLRLSEFGFVIDDQQAFLAHVRVRTSQVFLNAKNGLMRDKNYILIGFPRFFARAKCKASRNERKV